VRPHASVALIVAVLGCGAERTPASTSTASSEEALERAQAEHHAATGPAARLTDAARRGDTVFMVLAGVGDRFFCGAWRLALESDAEPGLASASLEMITTDGSTPSRCGLVIDAERGIVRVYRQGAVDYALDADAHGILLWVGEERLEHTHLFTEQAPCDRAAETLTRLASTGRTSGGPGPREREGPPGW